MHQLVNYHTFEQLLGLTLKDPKYFQFAELTGETPSFEDVTKKVVQVTFEQFGVAIVCSRDIQEIEHVFFLGPSKHQTHFYRGTFPESLDFDSSKLDVVRKLGAPFVQQYQNPLEPKIYRRRPGQKPPIEYLNYNLNGYLWGFKFDNRYQGRMFEANLRKASEIDLARAYMQKGQIAAAIPLFERQLKDQSYLSLELAECYRKVEEVSKAKKMFELAISQGKSSDGIVLGPARLKYAAFLQEQGDLQLALEQLVLCVKEKKQLKCEIQPEIKSRIWTLGAMLGIPEEEIQRTCNL